MDKLQLIELAAEELYKLKQHATEEEMTQLLEHHDILEGVMPSLCIYGWLTGSCYSPRAIELMYKCASGFFTNTTSLEPRETIQKDATIEGDVSFSNSFRNWSALEVALIEYQEEIKSLVKELAEAEMLV